MTSTTSNNSAPLTDAIIVAVSKLVDDAQAERYREPSHSEIQMQIERARLSVGDPNQQGSSLGKAKRVRTVLNWAMENDPIRGGRFVLALLGHIRGCGGFRSESPNYASTDAIQGAIEAFRSEGFVLGTDGMLTQRILEGLSGTELTDALESYVRRAKKGVEDAALLTGTSKDLVEATAAHILVSRFGQYTQTHNFPTLLAHAFVALGMSVPNDAQEDTPTNRLDRGLFEAACAINTLRNKEGTGHGRPWLPTVPYHLARTAVETMGLVSERMLNAFREAK